ncbi:phage tail protein [Lysinibacillus sp. 1 U-2021]|uniref:phage tail protein n=1 Tax=Lysinibacillus sp. 1 U-2021 TaxID=3039426 RepID=UPI00247FBCB3|nr:phage tail protein [Lysinibacillus sp. 1 U-2021]WGT38137.1 phage tail protein [Lysinibacillus sp. 1 U-2021]
MTIYSGIFNSVNGDRKYNAWWFAKYFATFIGNGVFPNPSTNLQVVSNENMKVVVKPGSGWIDGYFIFSDGDHVLSLDVADGVLKRIDRIVMRLDHLTRKIELVVKKGTFASNPVAPSLQRNTDAYELALADVLINNGATQVTQANITDQRLNTALCGIVHGTVNQVDTTTLFNQYQSWINQQKALYTQELELWTADQRQSFEQWMATQHGDLEAWKELEEQEFADWMLLQQTSFTNWMQQEQTDFEAWVATLQDLLDENIAATLTAKVATLEQNFSTHESTAASTSKAGHVQLNNTVTSTSTAQAATANAVKTVNDKAVSAENKTKDLEIMYWMGVN